MDKLQPQTVYVLHTGQTDYYVCQWNSDERKHVEPVRPRHGVYPLTGKELLQFAKDAAEASIKMSPEQFLKAKGVEI